MRLRWFEDMDEDENRPYDMEEPTSSACPSPTIPICGKWCSLIDLPPAAVTAGAISAAGWAHFSVSYPVRPTVSRKCRRTKELNGDYDFYRPIIGWRTMIDNRSLIRNKEREVPTWGMGYKALEA